MSREILFRAQRNTASKEWVEGYFFRDKNGRNFIYVKDRFPYDFAIDPSTVCQYTGLTDRYGEKIWENDICKVHGEEKENFAVTWDIYTANFKLKNDCLFLDIGNYWGFQLEVKGNVFDTPELLKGGTNEP